MPKRCSKDFRITIETPYPVPIANGPYQIEDSPVNGLLYVTSSTNKRLYVFDPVTALLVTSIVTNNETWGIIYVPSVQLLFVYTHNLVTNRIQVVNPLTATIVGTIVLPNSAGGVSNKFALCSSNNIIYAPFGSTVRRINPATQTDLGAIAGLVASTSACYVSSTDRIYATDGDGSVKVIDPGSNTVVNTIACAAGATNIAYASLTDQVFRSSNSASLEIIDPVTETVIGTTAALSDRAFEVYFRASDNAIYGSLTNVNKVARINCSDLSVTELTAAQYGFNGPRGIVENAADGKLYVVDNGNGQMSRVP